MTAGIEVSAFLAGQSTSWTAGTDLYVSKFAVDSPGTATCIYETGGLSPVMTMSSTRPTYERPGIQLVCRSTSYLTARNLADEAYLLLNDLSSTTVSGTTYLMVAAQQSPFDIGQDEEGRQLIACNYLVNKRVS